MASEKSSGGAQPDFQQWIGRRDIREDVIYPWPVRGLSAAFDLPSPSLQSGSHVPLGWHWLYFLDAATASELGVDGHPKRGGFLPPIDLPRRMWAGGRIEFMRPLRIGEEVRRESEILSVESKSGRSGKMVFVVVKHTIIGSGEITAIEEQDIVYREAARPGDAPVTGKPASVAPQWHRTMVADSTLLFRFSALTFNGHRIHYDLPYASDEERYPSLVVHGPMQALLMLDLCGREAGKKVTRLRYRGVAPLFHPAPFTVNGVQNESGDIELWTADRNGSQCMTAVAQFS
ncbi:MAG: MaoC family dehydratase N-terminal domain-containing protein [Steroidobacteraceae bacterium]